MIKFDSIGANVNMGTLYHMQHVVFVGNQKRAIACQNFSYQITSSFVCELVEMLGRQAGWRTDR